MLEKVELIKKEFEQADKQMLSFLYEVYANDQRSGVVSLISKYKKKEEKLEEEKKQLIAFLNEWYIENIVEKENFKKVFGFEHDEYYFEPKVFMEEVANIIRIESI